ncbi:hypothetical protein D3OALGA1CA_213 [Olavius algarvensis associated proteobacterium Delta 3]|nr:hypothetical protein D3OALGA1CA_213 [Olavius algarvensis associated proteobacterium Delta 3]CAB5156573.1 hypothetical protein D3OALGB2SA_5144 [Olavius algarvensis associated proteobacterium Delta 3]
MAHTLFLFTGPKIYFMRQPFFRIPLSGILKKILLCALGVSAMIFKPWAGLPSIND